MSDKDSAKPAEFLDSGVFHRALAALRASQEEQILIERSIGRAVIEKMSKRQPDLVEIYQRLGGTDPVVRTVLVAMTKAVTDLAIDKPIRLDELGKVAQGVINVPATAAHKSSAIAKGNPIFQIPDTALNTLASLGGDAFREKFGLG